MLSDTERAYRAELKATGKLAEDHRDEWKLPKALRQEAPRVRKSKAKDKAAVEALRAPVVEPAWEELSAVPDLDAVTELDGGAREADEAEGEDDAADPDSIAGHKAELKRLGVLKRQVTDEYMALVAADKETIAFYDKKLKLIESQEKAAMDQLKLFNKKRLDAENAANQVLIIIEPWQGDGTSKVQTWL